MAGRVTCRLHGGAADRLPAVVHNGLYSKHLAQLSDRFQQLINDPSQILDLNPGLALMGVYTESLLQRAMDGDSMQFRETARELWVQADRKLQFGATDDFKAVFDDLGSVLEEGVHADDVLAEAVNVAERRQVRVEKAAELELKHDEAMSTRAVLALFGEIIRVVTRSLPEEQATPIVQEIRTIATTRGSGRDVTE